MSEKIDMSKKYQEYYNQTILNTLTETLITGISYQANIKLANDVISENENIIKELNIKNVELNNEIEKSKNVNLVAENEKIKILENNLKEQHDKVLKLNNLISELEKFKYDYELTRQKSINSEILCNNLTKECETHKRTISERDAQIVDLKKQLDESNKILGMSPAKRKKYKEEQESNKQVPQKVEVKSVQMNEPPIVKKSTELIEKRRVEMSQKRQKDDVDDGGNF